jgi:hypothetical protein
MMNTISRKSEQGGARLKFLIVAAIIIAVAYAGYQFVPIFYQAYQIKDLMQHDVDTAVALGKSPDWIGEQLVRSAADYGIPANAVITPSQQDNRIQVRVQYSLPVEFPGYVYNYEFDHTAKSSTFLTIR